MTGEYRVGLIIPLQVEYEAVEQVFTRLGDFKADGHTYYRFQVPGTDIKVVAMIAFDPGLPSAAVAAQRLIGTFGVPLLAVMGIAGILDEDLTYGDVVVASEIQSYMNNAKAVPSEGGPGFALLSATTGWRPSAELVDFARNFRNRDAGRAPHQKWRAEARRRMLDAGADPGGAGPDFVVGPVASGDFVSAAESFKAFLLAKDRKYAAVEMEGAGAALAAYEQGDTDILVVRGVSDHADPGKSDQDRRLDRDGEPEVWRRHAARNAAELMAVLLGSPDFPWRERPRPDGPPPPAAPRKTSLLVAPLVLPLPVLGQGDHRPEPGDADGDSDTHHEAARTHTHVGHHPVHDPPGVRAGRRGRFGHDGPDTGHDDQDDDGDDGDG